MYAISILKEFLPGATRDAWAPGQGAGSDRAKLDAMTFNLVPALQLLARQTERVYLLMWDFGRFFGRNDIFLKN